MANFDAFYLILNSRALAQAKNSINSRFQATTKSLTFFIMKQLFDLNLLNLNSLDISNKK